MKWRLIREFDNEILYLNTNTGKKHLKNLKIINH